MPEVFNVDAARAGPRGRRRLRLQGGRRAAADAGLLACARRCGRPPAAFGPAGHAASTWRRPATPEAVYWARRGGRGGGRPHAGPTGAGVEPSRAPALHWRRLSMAPALGSGHGLADAPSSACASGASPACWSRSSPCAATRRARPAPRWSSPPTPPGARSAAATSRRRPSTRARELLADGARRRPSCSTVALSDKAPAEHGVQCCGGEVTVLLEPLPVVPVGRDLRGRPRRARAGPDPGPARPRPAPGRLARRPADRGAARGARRRRARGCTSTTCPCCPSWCSASCRRAPTCWS